MVDTLVLPWTRNKEPRSALSRIDTFCRILWHSDFTSSSLQMSLTCEGDCSLFKCNPFDLTLTTHQLENHLLLIQMLQFVARQSLRPTNNTRCAVLVLYKTRTGVALRVDAEEGWRAVNRIYNRLQKTAALELVCRDFPA